MSKTLFTGTSPELYQSFGNLIHWPMISIDAIEFSSDQLGDLIVSLRNADMIIFTSRYGVHYFFKLIANQGFDQKFFSQKEVAVIGKQTNVALKEYGIKPDLIGTIETGKGFFKEVKDHFIIEYKNILFPRSEISNPYLAENLRKLNAQVSEIPVYRNTKPADKNLPNMDINKVIFTSPSTVHNFIKSYKEIPSSWDVLSRGPKTQECLHSYGYQSEVITV